MDRHAKFAVEWTYRTISLTVTYPAGWEGPLSAERYAAAKTAEVLETETNNGDDGDGEPARRKGRAGKVEG